MLNQAQIIGHVGKEPKVRNLQSGGLVASFSIATTDKWKDKATGEQREATEWHRINVFGKLAEIVQKWVKKGNLVYVSGKIVTSKYQDKDGLEKQTTEIRADTLKLLGKPGSDNFAATPTQSAPKQSKTAPESDVYDLHDDIPF